MQTSILKIDAYAFLEAAAIVHLTVCRRHRLRPDWDNGKLLLLYDLTLIPAPWKDKIIGFARIEADKPGALDRAIQKLPNQFHESVFYTCVRIAAHQGYEEDLELLVELKEKMAIDDYRADIMIDLAKGEAEMARLAGKL